MQQFSVEKCIFLLTESLIWNRVLKTCGCIFLMLEYISLFSYFISFRLWLFSMCMDNLFYVDLILYTSCRIGIAIKWKLNMGTQVTCSLMKLGWRNIDFKNFLKFLTYSYGFVLIQYAFRIFNFSFKVFLF